MKTVKRLVYSALLLALALVLPFLTGQIPQIGSALSPMHIPVLLCGFVCGAPWGMAVGLIAPIMRSLLFQMPPMWPTAFAMAFELAAYGFATGLLYKLLPKKNIMIYVNLVTSMLIGRVVWGLVRFLIAGLGGSEFSIALFVAGAFTQAIPGIILHIVLIPILVMALKKGKILLND
ncbi:MAG: ECF transporter S component [Clostridia bacterium]|nr:ECF transporter S component [Oscillospiraceae bacterium]MBQ2748183.1 ECF transporter S component [Clostridia bacterium]MBQ4624026.1 ECF transporter S component [Clostridia bacterium]MBR6764345.1 ECF transporter S component [Clostridia bacterium]